MVLVLVLVLVFKLIDGEFARTGAHVDVIMDDMAYASYSSTKIRSNKMVFNDGMEKKMFLLHDADTT